MDDSITVLDIWYVYGTAYTKMPQISAPSAVKHHIPNAV